MRVAFYRFLDALDFSSLTPWLFIAGFVTFFFVAKWAKKQPWANR